MIVGGDEVNSTCTLPEMQISNSQCRLWGNSLLRSAQLRPALVISSISRVYDM
jgi:hypothetical protein